jgi:hypothetical protein
MWPRRYHVPTSIFREPHQADWAVPSSSSKNIAFAFSENVYSGAIPLRYEGRFAIVTTRGVGCDGLSVLQRAVSRADGQYGQDDEIVWSWHPGADAKLATMPMTGARTPVPEESAYKP